MHIFHISTFFYFSNHIATYVYFPKFFHIPTQRLTSPPTSIYQHFPIFPYFCYIFLYSYISTFLPTSLHSLPTYPTCFLFLLSIYSRYFPFFYFQPYSYLCIFSMFLYSQYFTFFFFFQPYNYLCIFSMFLYSQYFPFFFFQPYSYLFHIFVFSIFSIFCPYSYLCIFSMFLYFHISTFFYFSPYRSKWEYRNIGICGKYVACGNIERNR